MRPFILSALLALTLGLGLASVVRADPPVTSTSSQAVLISASESVYSAGSSESCSGQTKLGSKVHAHFSKPRPPQDCFMCATLCCEWRFLFSGCRAFFDQGRFAPTDCSECRRR